jgi:N-acetylglucosaminylphosphatidylinositol deacetylase
MNRLTTTLIVLLLAVLYSAVSPAHDGKVFTHNLYLHRQNIKVLLVTAHPDDECMFFGPTILALRARNVEVHSLCLSVGNQDGLGSTRRHELFDSLDVLDIPAGKREVVDSPYVIRHFDRLISPIWF